MKRIEIVNHDEKNQVQKTADNTDLANATEADGQTSQPSQSSFLNAKIFWGNDAVKLPTRYLYRGTISTPHQKFAEGFTARGTNPDLLLHVRPGGSWNIYGNYVANSDSVYISTSTSKQVGMFFPFGEARRKNGQTYLYQINPQATAVDMLPVANLIDDAEYVKQIKAEKEMGVPHKIKPQDIKGAWTVKNGEHGYTRSGYTKNPNYIPSAPQYWRVPKAIRHTVTGLGVALDGWGLNLAYQKSIETNNYHHFFNESVRVAGGWSGSVALGQAGAAWCSPIPYGSLVCGVAGSFIGYLGGAQLGEMAYAHSKTDPDEIYTVSGCEMPIQANQASVLGNKIVNCIDKLGDFLSETLDQLNPFEQLFPSAYATEHSEKMPVVNSIGDALGAMQSQNESKPDVTLEQYEDVAAQFHPATTQVYTSWPSPNGHNGTYDMTKIPRKTSVAQISTRKSTPLQPKSDLSASKKDMKSSRQSTYKSKQSLVDVQHANELTDFLNQQSMQYIEKAEAARLASADLSQIYQHNKKPKSVLSEEHRLVVQKASDTMQEFGSASAELSRFALHLGGHQRTWEGVGKFGNELSSLGTSLEKFSNASSLFSLQSFSGTLGTLNAVMGIADTLFGKKKESELSVMRKEMNQGFTMIMAALQAVYQDMKKGFQNLETLIQDNMYVVLTHIQEMNAKLDRLESIMTSSFREVQMKDLIDAIYKIKRDFKYKNLTDEQRKELLEELGSWLENHCKSSIQTSVSRDSNDVATCVRIMGSSDFDGAAMFPYLMRQLTKEHVIPHHLLPDNVLTQPLSNLALQHTVAEIYCAAVIRYKMTDSCRMAPLDSTINSVQETERLVSEIRDSKMIWKMLLKQHHNYRYQVGRAIAKCRTDISDSASNKESFGALLTSGRNKERLMEPLDRMEFIRWLLIRLQEVTGLTDHSICDAIKNLETKNHVLQTLKSVYDTANASFVYNVQKGRYLGVRENILNGADINQVVPKWRTINAQVIHCLCQDSNRLTHQKADFFQQVLHLFFMCEQDVEIDKSTTSQWNNYGTYWHAGVTPISLSYNAGGFHLMMLWIASGFKVTADSFYGANYANENVWTFIVQKYLIQTFNGEKRDDLVKAYRFYQDFEKGFAYTPNETIDVNCLLWLICILGNTELLELLTDLSLDVNQSIPHCHFTPLMMATYCGQEKVVNWLLSKGANVNVAFATVDPHPDGSGRNFALSESKKPHLLHLAIGDGDWGHDRRKHGYKVAQKLVDAGLIPTTEQKKIIKNGLSTLVIVPSQESKQATMQAMMRNHTDNTLALIHSTNRCLSETKTWLLEKKATDIGSQHQQAMDELVQRGIQQLNIDQKRYSMALWHVKQLMENIRPVVESGIVSISEFSSKTEDFYKIESEFGDLIESVSDFTDEQFIGYEAPGAHRLPVSSEEIPSLKTHILEQRCQKETESLGFSFQRTTELLTQVASHFNALPKEKAPAVLFIGQTGAGKSTAVNGLLGVEYHKEKVKRKIIVHTEQPEYAKTNNSKKSETPFPKVFLSSDSSHYLVDMPGYGDTGGVPERISHGISTQWLRKRFQALKGMVIVCEENDINSSKCQLLRDTLENAGRMICQMPEQASQHLLFAVTKSKEMSLDDIFEELRDLKEEFKASYKEDAPEHYIAIALSALTQSKEQIILLDVTAPESLAKMHQKIKIMPAHDATAFNFTHASPEFTLLTKVVQIILDIKTELEQDIQQRRDALTCLYKTTLAQQLVVLDKSDDTITQECEAMLLSFDSIDCSSVKCFSDFVKWHSELIEKFKSAMTTLSKTLGGTEKDQLIGKGQDLRAELIAQYQELKSNQAFFDSMLVIQEILNPHLGAKFSADDNELDGYETDKGAADDLECFARSIIPANHVLVENADKSEIVSIFRKRGTIPGEYESNPSYMGLVQHTLFKQPLSARYIGNVDEYAYGVIVRLSTSQVV